MTICTVTETMSRIEAATKESPIAVFTSEIEGRVNSMFSKTIKTQKLIKNKRPDLIGVYHQGYELVNLKNKLIRVSK